MLRGMVDRRGEVLSGTRRGAEHDEIGRALGGDQELTEYAGEPGVRRCTVRGRPRGPVATLGWHGIHEPAVGVPHAYGIELDQIARDRRRRRIDSVRVEQLREITLRAYELVAEQLDDELLAGGLGRRNVHADCPAFARSQTSKAFWACRRFSASSHTTLCGPSRTSDEISRPR